MMFLTFILVSAAHKTTFANVFYLIYVKLFVHSSPLKHYRIVTVMLKSVLNTHF